MLELRRWRARSLRDDSGYTLVELMVVVVVFGVLATMVTVTLINIMQSSRKADERSFRTTQANTAMERISRDIRVAIPVTTAEDDRVAMEVYRNGKCERHTYFLSAVAGQTQLNAATQAYAASTSCLNATGTPGAAAVSTLVRHVDPAAAPIFVYQAAGAAGSLSAPVAASSLADINAITVTVTVLGPEGTDNISMTTSAQLRNS